MVDQAKFEAACTNLTLIVAGIVLFIGLIVYYNRIKLIKNVSHVKILRGMDFYTQGYEAVGNSYNWDTGHYTTHYAKTTRYDGEGYEFEVTYKDGRVRVFSEKKSSSNCQYLLKFYKNQEEQEQAAREEEARLEEETRREKERQDQSVLWGKPAGTVEKEDTPPHEQDEEDDEDFIDELMIETTRSTGVYTPPTAKPAPVQKVYKPGQYKIGFNMPAGKYLVIPTMEDSAAFFEVAKPVGNTLFLENVAGFAIVEVFNGEYFEFNWAKVEPYTNQDIAKSSFDSGTLLVGTHIPAGEYVFTSLHEDERTEAFVAVYDAFRYDSDHMQEFEAFPRTKFLNLKDGEVIMYGRCKLELMENTSPKG